MYLCATFSKSNTDKLGNEESKQKSGCGATWQLRNSIVAQQNDENADVSLSADALFAKKSLMVARAQMPVPRSCLQHLGASQDIIMKRISDVDSTGPHEDDTVSLRWC